MQKDKSIFWHYAWISLFYQKTLELRTAPRQLQDRVLLHVSYA